MLYVLRHYHTLIEMDANFRDVLRNLPFLPRKDMFLTTDRLVFKTWHCLRLSIIYLKKDFRLDVIV